MRVQRRGAELAQASQPRQTNIVEREPAKAALRRRLAMQELVTLLATRFINLPPGEVEGEMMRALQAVGEFAGVERCTIDLLSADGLAIDRIYEWCAKGIEPLAKKLTGLSVERFHWSAEQIKQSGSIQARCVPPEASAEKEIWTHSLRVSWGETGITSLVGVPLISDNTPKGFFFGFAKRAPSEKTWREEDIQLLKLMGEVFVNVLA